MLKQIFIKNYKNTEDNEVRNKYGKVAGIFGIISNLILGIIKLFIGFISHSVSIMADAINNISDMATSILTIIGFKLANKKPDKKHPYGYARYEYISGFVIALFMIVMGVILAQESIIKIIHPEELVINSLTYIILIIAIIGKGLQMLVYLDFSKSINSNTLKTNALDTRNDIISTTAILISMIIMGILKINLDGYLGTIVSLFVVYSSVKSLFEALDPIIGIVPTDEQIKEITDKLLSYEYVQGIHDLVIHNYGVNNDFITVHVEIDSKLDILIAHDLMDNIENDFKEEFGTQLTIHMDPIVIGDKVVDELKEETIKAIEEFDPELKIHDFRVVKGKTHTNIIFDCVVPYEKDYTVYDIRKHLVKKFKDKNHKYFFVIEIDRAFC